MPNTQKADSIPEPSHFRPWTPEMLYAVEPGLEVIARQTVAKRRRRIDGRYLAYASAKKAVWRLVGWYAHDPRLRSSEAWDCYFRYIVKELKI